MIKNGSQLTVIKTVDGSQLTVKTVYSSQFSVRGSRL